MRSPENQQSLYEQLKDVERIGSRISGEPEVIHDLQDYFRSPGNEFPIIRDQIKIILEYVPSVFPEGWKSPGRYDDLTPEQKEAHDNIARNGIIRCPGLVIEKVVELGVDYRTKHSVSA